MKNISDFFFSMALMGFLILFMAISAATATFIENDFGPAAAKAMVYDAWWFKLLLVLIIVNMLGNMIRRKIYKKRTLTIFLIHFAFLFILVGAAITRYISYEGTMHIREGESSDKIISAGSFLYGSVDNGTEKVGFYNEFQYVPNKKIQFKRKLAIGADNYTIKLVKYIPNAERTLIPDPEGGPVVSLMVLGKGGREDHMLKQGEWIENSGQVIGFGHDMGKDNFYIYRQDSRLFFISTENILKMDMSTGSEDTLIAGSAYVFEKRKLYTSGSFQVVQTDYLDRGRIDWVSGSDNNQQQLDILVMQISGNRLQKEFMVYGKGDRLGVPYTTQLNKIKFTVSYGSRWIRLPFTLRLKNFQLERYPGSNSPASFASEVILIDKQNGIEAPYRIFMNNILNYRGFKFFQSSYDNDEKGTILSVNHDSWGTTFTYVGYFLMILGMILSLFNRNSRFMKLVRSGRNAGNDKKITSVATILIIIFLQTFSLSGKAQTIGGELGVKVFPAGQANSFASVLVQDQGGRIKPMQSLAYDIVRKVTKKEKFESFDPVQVVMSMYFYPESWQKVSMFKISNNQILEIMDIDEKYASFLDFFNPNAHNSYKLFSYVQEAYQKRPALRTKFDQEVIKMDERVNICGLVYSGTLLKIFPAKNDPNNTWYSPVDAAIHVPEDDSLFVSGILDMYIAAVNEGRQGNATEIIKGIKKYQKLSAGNLIPDDSKISLEISYNKYSIFDNLSKYYGVIGFVFLIVLFVKILNKNIGAEKFIKVIILLLILVFIGHTFGLAVRWYISGHAPWSNGYESMIYIAWATMLAGLLFAKKSPFALVAAAILSALTLFVAHMSWMNPEITNLVPVLKSYWLTIHVSVITASYGFLGVGMILGLLNLVLYIMKTRKNQFRIQEHIKSLSEINEMSLILGVYFISIGTFLGAVWANESWGRYWGWDPKETWALITMLVFILIIHMRLIPGLKGYFAFNLASVIGFFSVLMTYFGVNYYLAGLHSYAAGDAVPIPKFVYYTLFTLFLIILFAYINEKKYRKSADSKAK